MLEEFEFEGTITEKNVRQKKINEDNGNHNGEAQDKQ